MAARHSKANTQETSVGRTLVGQGKLALFWRLLRAQGLLKGSFRAV